MMAKKSATAKNNFPSPFHACPYFLKVAFYRRASVKHKQRAGQQFLPFVVQCLAADCSVAAVILGGPGKERLVVVVHVSAGFHARAEFVFLAFFETLEPHGTIRDKPDGERKERNQAVAPAGKRA